MRYDKPVLAMVKALNEIAGGGFHHGAFVNSAWQFYMGDTLPGERHWGFHDALTKCESLWNGVQSEYRPGAYRRRELWVSCAEKINV